MASALPGENKKSSPHARDGTPLASLMRDIRCTFALCTRRSSRPCQPSFASCRRASLILMNHHSCAGDEEVANDASEQVRSEVGRTGTRVREPRVGPCNTRVDMMKQRQSSKISEIGDALVASGISSLDQQASALGLSRSTTWTILKANHKASGLSATVINRMLAVPQLPPLVRAVLVEYIADKTAGAYGHSELQRRRFTARLSLQRTRPSRKTTSAVPRPSRTSVSW